MTVTMLSRPRASALLTVVSLVSLTLASTASADEKHPRVAQTKVAQSKKGDRNRPPPAPPLPPPAPAAAPAPSPAAAPATPPADPNAPLPPPNVPVAQPASAPAASGQGYVTAPLPPPSITTTTSSSLQVNGEYDGRRRRYDEDRRDDDGGHPNWVLFGGGTALFATAWSATGATTTAICDGKCKSGEEGVAWIPLAGPPIVGAVGKPSGGQIAALTAAFISQGTGFALMVVGLATTTGSDRPSYRDRDRGAAAKPTFYVTPQLGAAAGGTNGMMMGGTF